VHHPVLLRSRIRHEGLLAPNHIVEVVQHVGLLNVDHVGELCVALFYVNNVEGRLKVVGEIGGVVPGVLGTVGAVGREENAVEVNHDASGKIEERS
jgi:hypothetical protein